MVGALLSYAAAWWILIGVGGLAVVVETRPGRRLVGGLFRRVPARGLPDTPLRDYGSPGPLGLVLLLCWISLVAFAAWRWA